MKYISYNAMPPELRKQLIKDKFMRKCCIDNDECCGRVEWHHALKYAGVRMQVWWSVVPVCSEHHANADRPDIRKKIVKVMRSRGGDEVKVFEKISRIR